MTNRKKEKLTCLTIGHNWIQDLETYKKYCSKCGKEKNLTKERKG